MQALRGSALGYRYTHPDHPGWWTVTKIMGDRLVLARLPEKSEEIEVPRAGWSTTSGWKCIGP